MFVCVLCAFFLCLYSLRWDSQPTWLYTVSKFFFLNSLISNQNYSDSIS
jgi:hypothetical protein